MLKRKRSDTSVQSIEETYGIDLHVRSDALLGNLLRTRGFRSLSQLLDAYHGRLTYHARRRRIFVSFHAEDFPQVNGFRLMMNNPGVELDLADNSLKAQVDSDNETYVRRVIRDKIRRAEVIVCLIGHGTAWRDWVDWELNTGLSLGKGICGVRLRGSRGRAPAALGEVSAPVAQWDVTKIVAAIECAAARRG